MCHRGTTHVFLFKPNDVTHKAFGDKLREAEKSGVNIIAMSCKVTENSIEMLKEIEVEL